MQFSLRYRCTALNSKIENCLHHWSENEKPTIAINLHNVIFTIQTKKWVWKDTTVRYISINVFQKRGSFFRRWTIYPRRDIYWISEPIKLSTIKLHEKKQQDGTLKDCSRKNKIYFAIILSFGFKLIKLYIRLIS